MNRLSRKFSKFAIALLFLGQALDLSASAETVPEFIQKNRSELEHPTNNSTPYYSVEIQEQELQKNFDFYLKENPKIDPKNCVFSLGETKEFLFTKTENEFAGWETDRLAEYQTLSEPKAGKFVIGLNKLALDHDSIEKKIALNDKVKGYAGLTHSLIKYYLAALQNKQTISHIQISRSYIEETLKTAAEDFEAFALGTLNVKKEDIEWLSTADKHVSFQYTEMTEIPHLVSLSYHSVIVNCKKTNKPFTMEAIENINVPEEK